MHKNNYLIFGIVLLFLFSLPNVLGQIPSGAVHVFTFDNSVNTIPTFLKQDLGTMNLTGTGTITQGVVGKNNEAFFFNNSYLNKTGGTTLNVTGGVAYTISFWFKYSNYTANMNLLHPSNNPANALWGVNWDGTDGKFAMAINSGNDIIKTGTRDDAWHNSVTVVLANKSYYQYIDGYFVDDDVAGGQSLTNQFFYIGHQEGQTTRDLRGYIDELYIFNRSLNATEVLSLNNSFYEPITAGVSFVNPTPANNSYKFTPNNTITINVSFTTLNISNDLNLTILKDGVLFASGFDNYTSSGGFKTLNLTTGTYTIFANGTDATNQSLKYTTGQRTFFVDKGILSLSAVNLTGQAINSFTVQINGTTYNTTSGTISQTLSLGSYFIYFNTSGYAFTNVTLNLQNASRGYQFIGFPNNFVNLSIYDALTSMLITQPMNVVVTASSATNYSTSTGNILFQGLDSGLNEFKAYNVNYSEGRVYLDIVNGSAQILRIYLLANGTLSEVVINWFDVNGAPISNMYVTESVVTANGSVLAASYYTDIDGASYFDYNSLYYYLYNCSSTVYSCQGFILNPPRKSSYDVTLGYLVSSPSYSVINVTGSVSYNNVSKILNFSYISLDLSLSNYSYYVSQSINGVNVVLCSASSVDDSDSFTCDLTGRSGIVFVQGNVNNNAFFGSYVDLGGTVKLLGQMSIQDRSFISGFLMLIIVFFGLILGVVGTLIIGVLSLVILYFLGINSVITTSLIIVSIVVSLIIALGVRRRA